MDKWIRILKKENDRELLKMPQVRQQIAQLNRTLSPFHLNRSVRNARDLYTLQIMAEGLKNKQAIENGYETTRQEMLDIWEMLDYPKRNEFLKPRIRALIQPMKQFLWHGKTILIPFFDEVINALYDHETAILELPQFFRMYRDFAGKTIDPLVYGRLPYDAGFAQAQVIAQTDQGFAVYEGRSHSLEVFFFDGSVVSLPLSIHCTGTRLDVPQGEHLAVAVLRKDRAQLHEALQRSGYIAQRLKKKIRL